MNFEQKGIIESSLEDLVPSKEADWTNYPKGVMWAFGEKGMPVEYGMDLVLFGNIPNASGLSSSASVEVLTGFILRDMFGFNAPIQLENAKIIISCSNKKRGLGDSKYNERRRECETALAEIQTVKEIQSLGELTEEEFEAVKDNIESDIRMKRAKHAVYENQRTRKAVQALQNQDIALFGELMNASHVSLRDDYEVTGMELDTLVEEAWKVEGVIGSRMTGAGFGGCTVSIVKDEAVDVFIAQVGKAYESKTGYPADFYVVEIGGGPQVCTG